jgi:hypothetical protein
MKAANNQTFESLLDWINDTHQEKDLLVALVRKGWITENGELAKDLSFEFDSVVDEAFNNKA